MTHEQIIWQGITALVTILTVVAAYLKTRQQRDVQHTETVEKLDNVQQIVNGQSDAKDARVSQLEQALTAAGVEVPKVQPEVG